MSQEKNEYCPIAELPHELISLIIGQIGEPQVVKSFFTYFPIFRSGDDRTQRILSRLAEYAAQANIDRIVGLLKIRPDLRLNVLFTLAGLGAQDEMKPILTEHPEDLLVYSPLRDISTAEFERITLFQHAVWAKDVRYMAPMMLDCLPHNEKGENIRMELLRQYNELMNEGVSYSLHGVKHERKHYFDLKPLLDTLRTYADKYVVSIQKELEEYWCEYVGFEQTKLPANIRHHYCDPEISFWNKPDFQKPNLKRSLIINWSINKFEFWCESLKGLGSISGVYSGGETRQAVTVRAPYGWVDITSGWVDLEALTTLDEVRTTIDIPALEQRLKTPIQNKDIHCEMYKSAP